MSLTAAQIAEQIDGTLFGDPQTCVSDVSSLSQPMPGTLSFLADIREIKQLAQTPAAIVLLPEECQPERINTTATALITVEDPFAAFMQLISQFRTSTAQLATGIAPSAEVDPTVQLGDQVAIGSRAIIGPGCQIGDRCQIHAGVTLGANVILGNDVILYPNVVIYAGCELRDRVAVHAGSVIGADGFGYRFQQGQFEKLPHFGSVLIHEDVEIGACTTIDRGMIDSTVIGRGTKIDNQVMIAHNCQIGEHNIIVSQVGLAGSVETGDFCRFGGQVGIADHVKVGKNSSLVARSGVFRDIPENEIHGGTPAVPMHEQKKIALAMLKLPELRQTVRQLQKQIADLEQQVNQQEATPATSLQQSKRAA